VPGRRTLCFDALLDLAIEPRLFNRVTWTCRARYSERMDIAANGERLRCAIHRAETRGCRAIARQLSYALNRFYDAFGRAARCAAEPKRKVRPPMRFRKHEMQKRTTFFSTLLPTTPQQVSPRGESGPKSDAPFTSRGGSPSRGAQASIHVVQRTSSSRKNTRDASMDDGSAPSPTRMAA
jgi:hypothetical protein